MTKSPRKNVLDVGIELGVACMLSEHGLPIELPCPAHKKVTYIQSNYRGISITSNLGKRFNKIIHSCLLEFVYEHNVIFENQIGFFKKQSRTSDNMFTLKPFIEHYKAQKQNVYAACIDLRKTFDTVWRECLFYKNACSGYHKSLSINFALIIWTPF